MPKPEKNDPLVNVMNAMFNPELRQKYLMDLGINNKKNKCTYIDNYSKKLGSKRAVSLQKQAASSQQTQESTDAAKSKSSESRKTIR